MRVIEPKNFTSKPVENDRPKRRRSGISFIVTLLIIAMPLVALGGYIYANIYVVEKEIEDIAQSNPGQDILGFELPENDPFDTTIRPLKVLKGDEFTDLYSSVIYPNTQLIADPPTITGDDDVDAKIRSLAEARGYSRTPTPEQAVVRIQDEPRLDSTDNLLQPLAAKDWQRLKKAASDDGYALSLLSAYRSPEAQREIFLNRLYASISLEDLKNGNGEAIINATLELTAVPGYSRHHTGYTIDLWCEDGSLAFVASDCYQWISQNNYEMAMEYGWIPSYPEGSKTQGPEPEPWEYVWVGDATRESAS